jgi:hypothetical protein
MTLRRIITMPPPGSPTAVLIRRRNAGLTGRLLVRSAAAHTVREIGRKQRVERGEIRS